MGIVAIVAGLIVLVQVWPIGDWPRDSLAVAATLLLVGLVATRFGWKLHDNFPQPAHHPCAVDLVSFNQLDISAAELQDVALLLGKPAEHCERVTHEIGPRGNYLSNRVLRVLNLGAFRRHRELDDEINRVIVPVLHPERGHLVDNLGLEVPANVSAHLCPSGIASTLTYRALCLITIDAYQRTDEVMMATLEALREYVVADQTLIHDTTAIARFAAGLDELAALQPAPYALHDGWTSRRSELIRLWSANISSYTVFAILEGRDLPSRLTFTVTYSKPLSEVRGVNVSSTKFDYDIGDAGRNFWKDRLRGWLGVQPWIYRFPLSYERASQSYNLRFSGADDQYVFRLTVRRKEGAAIVATPAHLAATRNSDSHTMPFAHLYLRPIEGVYSRGELRARIAVRERPPGVLGLVALVGVAQLIFLAVVVGAYGRIFRTESGAEIAAVLLATPSVIYTWVGSQLSPGRLSRVPLAAVGGMALNGFISVIAAALALLAANDVDPWSFSVGRLDIAHPLWLLLLTVCSWGVGNQAMRWHHNTRAFVNREFEVSTVLRFAV